MPTGTHGVPTGNSWVLRGLRRSLLFRVSYVREDACPQVLTGYSWVVRGLRCDLLVRVGYTREDACVPMNLRRAASQCLNVELTP